MAQAPPVIPEIVKAYQNDPRTLLALKAMAQGSDGSPVAGGGYGYADGIARVLGGLGGAMITKQQNKAYGDAQSQYQKDYNSSINPASAPPPAPGGGQPPPMAQSAPTSSADAIAAALGGGGVSPGMSPTPQAPIAPSGPMSAPQAPALGGQPGGAAPFGPSSPPGSGAGALPSFMTQPVPEAVPQGPAPVARAVAPNAVGPTTSLGMEQGRRMVANGNPYLFSGGKDLYEQGLGEQTKLNESAAERKQRLADMVFSADRSDQSTGDQQDRSAVIKDRQDVIARNAAALEKLNDQKFTYGVHKEDQSFNASENAKNRAKDIQVANIGAAGKAARAGSTGGWGLTDAEQDAINKAAAEGRIDVSRLNSRTAKINAQIFLANPKFDAMTNHGTAALIGNATAQQKVVMASTLPDVLRNVRDAGKKMNYSDLQFVGKLQQLAKGQINDPDLAAYRQARVDAVQTMAQVYRGTGATDKATALENDASPSTMSPRAYDAWYSAQMKALAPRLQQYENRKLLPEGTVSELLSGTAPDTPASGGWGKAAVVK